MVRLIQIKKTIVYHGLLVMLLGGTILTPSAFAATGASSSSSNTIGVEGLLSAPIKPIANAVATPAVAPVAAAPNVPMVAGAAEIESLREDNARLTRALADQRQNFENAQASNSGAALNELRQKLEAANVENDRLKRAVEEARATAKVVPIAPALTPSPDFTAKLNAVTIDLQKSNKTLAALQSENATLKSQLAAKGDADAKFANISADAQKTKQTLDVLKQENVTLKNQIAIYQSQQKDVSQTATSTQAQIKATSDKLTAIQLENQTLKNQVANLTAAVNAKPQSVATPVADPKVLQQISALQAENAQLKTTLKTTLAAKPAAQQCAPVVNSADADKLRAELRDVRVQNDAAVTEKAAIQAQLEKLQREVNTTQLKQSGGNWDLEQATRRYQESQREIQRLGALLQTQQTKCTSEKKEIEGMLFDPAIANNAQIAMVNSLKEELAQKDSKIKELEAGGMTKEQAFAPTITPQTETADAKILREELAYTKQQLSETKASIARRDIAKTSLQAASAQSLEMATMRGQLDQSNKRIAELQQALGSSGATAGGVMKVSPVSPPVPLGEVKEIAPLPAPKPVAVVPPLPPSDLHFTSIGDFTMLLKSAGVPLQGGLQKIAGGDPETYRAYSWKTSSLFGSVEMRYAPDTDSFGEVVQSYLNRAKSRCSGEFAAIPSETRSANIGMSKSYEIACVSDAASSSASVLFTYGDNMTMTVAHEGRAEAMDMAMDVRDKIAEKIR